MAASRQLHTTALAVFGLAYVAVGILAVSTGDPAFAFGLILTVIGLFLATCTSVLAHQAVAFQYRVFRIRMDKRWFELPGRAFGLLAILYAALMLLGVIRP